MLREQVRKRLQSEKRRAQVGCCSRPDEASKLDESAEAKLVAQSLNANATPTFVFWVGGREVGRISTADRAVLMQAVLETQQKFGVPLPQPPPRKRMSTAEAKEIARQKREQQKKSAW